MSDEAKDTGQVVNLPGVLAAQNESLVNRLRAEAFEPTERMVAARKRIRELVDSGVVSPLDWLAQARKEGVVSSEEWREWQDLDGFDVWIYEDLYPKPSANALRSLTEVWFGGLSKALGSGDMKAVKWFHDEVLAKEDTGKTALDRALEQRVEKGNPWKRERRAKAAGEGQ